jgi:hypothetical protein
MAAANLEDAANLAYARSSIRWTANTLRANFQTYVIACAAVLTDATANDRSVGNWLAPMSALATNMNASTANPLEQELYNRCVDYLYRFNMAGAYAQAQGRITAAQATALLAAYNASIF